MHTPVFIDEAISALDIKRGGKYIDATVGEGGHLARMLKQGARVLGIDQDQSQVKSLELEVQNSRNATIVCGNFADIESIAKAHDFAKVDGVLFDLGLSMKQLQQSGRGLSYRNVGEYLDMRLREELEETAAELINSLSEDKLYEVFASYGEEVRSAEIAHAVCRARTLRRIETVGDLIVVIDSVVGHSDLRVYSRIFQALRIVVNNELVNLQEGLIGAYKLLDLSGRLAVISFHSLEDRMVKNFMKKHAHAKRDMTVFKNRHAKQFERSAILRVLTKHEKIN